MVTINKKTKKIIEDLAKSYSLTIKYDYSDSPFQESAVRKNKHIIIKSSIEPSEFDSLFDQHRTNFDVKRDQEMFIFNTLHGIGHFKLNLWKPKTKDEIADRLVNFDQDVIIDKWAFEELLKLRENNSANT